MLKQVSPFAVPAYILFQISLVISTVVEFISTGVVLRAVLIVTIALPVLLVVGARPMPLGLTLPIGSSTAPLIYCDVRLDLAGSAVRPKSSLQAGS